MAVLEPENFKTKNKSSLEIRSLSLDDVEKVHNFFGQVAEDSTNTLRCKENEIPQDKLEK